MSLTPTWSRLRGWLSIAFCLSGLCSGAAMANPTGITIDRQILPPHLDPTRTASASTAEVTHMNVFQGLTRIDQHGQLSPALATDWQLSEDRLTLTFQLREDVEFHDRRPCDAEVAAL